MQDFLHTSHDEVLQAVERFEKMIGTDKVEYFDVHQIETIYEFYFDKNLPEQAERILNIGLAQHPDSSSLLVKKAIFISDHGDLDEAYELLLELAPIESTNPDVFMTLGWIMLQKNNTAKAMDYFHKAVDISFDDDKEEVLLEISYNLNQHEFYLESINFLEQLLEINPDNENALFEYAFSLDKVLEYEQSIKTYERLLDVNPFSENGWYNLGIIHNKLGDFTEALKAYDFAIAINPQHEEAFFNKGNSLVQSGYFQEAIDAYIEHISLSQDALLTYQYIADCWDQLSNYDLAIRFYQFVIKEAPKQADAWYGLGTTLMEKENFTGGLQAIDQAISINPLNADYWFAHARGLFELDKGEDAARSLENGLNLDPHELTGWIELIKLRMVLDGNFQPNVYVNELLQQYEDVAAIFYLSAIIHYQFMDDKTAAVIDLQKALTLDHEGLQDIAEDYPEFLADPMIQQIIQQHTQTN